MDNSFVDVGVTRPLSYVSHTLVHKRGLFPVKDIGYCHGNNKPKEWGALAGGKKVVKKSSASLWVGLVVEGEY